MNKIFQFAAVVSLGFAISGCDFYDLDEADLNDAIPSEDAYVDLASARTARAGLYDALQLDGDETFDGYLSSWQYFSDEADWSGTFPTREQFDIYTVDPANITLGAIFSEFYEVINVANNLINGVQGITGDQALTEERRNSLIAEGRFARAFAYFYLTMGWVDVPLVTEPTTEATDVLNVSASPQSEVYALIEEDLAFAVDNLIASESLGITREAALALLARVNFLQRDYMAAADFAAQALGDTSSFDLTDFEYLEDVIFAVEYSATDGNAFAFYYASTDRNGRYSIHPSDELIAAYEPGDLRFPLSIDTSETLPVGLKYDDFDSASGAQSDPMLAFRHAEMVLILGESLARAGNYDAAEKWLNQVRRRAGLPAITDLDASNFEDIFLQEFFVELAMEGGHRLWQVRRVNRAMEFFGPNYESCDDRWPFPQRELDRNPALMQNSACLG